MEMELEMEMVGMSIFGVLLVIYLLLFAFSLVCYVFQALSLSAIAKRRNVSKPWLAWIPIGNMWLMGCLSDQFQAYTRNKVTNRRKVLMGLVVALFALFALFIVVTVLAAVMESEAALAIAVVGGMAFYFGMLGITIALVVIEYMVLYDIFNSCDPGNATAFLIISIVFSVALPFLLFAVRNKDQGMISWQQKQWQAQQWQQQQWQAQQQAQQYQQWQAQQYQQWQQQQAQQQQRQDLQ